MDGGVCEDVALGPINAQHFTKELQWRPLTRRKCAGAGEPNEMKSSNLRLSRKPVGWTGVRRLTFFVLSDITVVRKIAIAVLLVVAMATASAPLSARSCSSSLAVNKQACSRPCCGKKSCCAKPGKDAVPSAQPLATNTAGHELLPWYQFQCRGRCWQISVRGAHVLFRIEGHRQLTADAHSSLHFSDLI